MFMSKIKQINNKNKYVSLPSQKMTYFMQLQNYFDFYTVCGNPSSGAHITL